MAITFIKQKKTQKYLIYILIGAVVVMIVAWFVFFRKTETVSVQIIPIESSMAWKKIDISLEILENPIFKSLKELEKAPTFEGKTGRINPFSPF